MPFVAGESVGPYRITRQLGMGGMATVWKAYHSALDRYVAIKVLHPSFKEDQQFTERFHREARIVAKLTHPHIVPIYDFSQHEGMSYLVMRYIEGRTLKAVLKEHEGPIAPDRVAEILGPACQALAYAHDQGVLHRDIKPSNFLINDEGEVFLTDFGLARMAEATDTTLSRDMLVGTPQYISPEQARGEKLDGRTDIYSLGVVLFEMLAGKVPYDADTPYAVIHDHIFAPLPLPTRFNPEIPEVAERVVLKALAKDRDDRFQTVDDLISALQEATGASAIELEASALPSPEGEEAAGLEPESERGPEVGERVPLSEAEPDHTRKPPPGSGCRWRRLFAVIAVVVAVLSLCACGFVFVLATANPESDEPPIGATETVEPAREDPIAHMQLARQHLQQGNVEGALAEYEVAIQLDPSLVEAHVALGNLYLRDKETETALDHYLTALDIEPDHAKAHLGAGDAYLVQWELDASRFHYQTVVDLDPSVPGPLAKLGMCNVLQGDVEVGRRECDRALQMDPEVPEGHFCMGLYYAKQGETDRARSEFEIVVDTAPGFLAEQARRQLDRLD